MRFTLIGLVVLVLSVMVPTSGAAQSSRAPAPECPEFPAKRAVDPEHPVRSFPQADYLRGPAPVYPAALKGLRVEGRVVLRFVVRCDGRVDSSSVRVMTATDTAFIRAAVRVVLGSEYRAAVFEGQRVSVPVEQIVRFHPKSSM